MFKNHGTKFIGGLTTLASIIAAADPSQVTALLGSSGQYAVTGILGILTIVRGFQNSKV